MKKYTLIEKRIINVLYYRQRPLTTYHLSKITGYSYVTVRKYLHRLYDKGLLHYKTVGKSIYWWIKT